MASSSKREPVQLLTTRSFNVDGNVDGKSRMGSLGAFACESRLDGSKDSKSLGA
jgi:hypothetical protein